MAAGKFGWPPAKFPGATPEFLGCPSSITRGISRLAFRKESNFAKVHFHGNPPWGFGLFPVHFPGGGLSRNLISRGTPRCISREMPSREFPVKLHGKCGRGSREISGVSPGDFPDGQPNSPGGFQGHFPGGQPNSPVNSPGDFHGNPFPGKCPKFPGEYG